MPAALNYPGVYVEEIPSGVRTIVGVPTAIAAFVGRALKGPVNEATVITSYADYERMFGGLWVESAMSYAVRDFYLNGGGRAVIVRLVHAAPPAAGGDPEPPPARTIKVNDMTFVAAWSGDWAQALRIELTLPPALVAAKSANPEDVKVPSTAPFNLTVRDAAPGGASEQFLNVTLGPGPRQLDKVLAANSQLVLVKDKIPEDKTLTFVKLQPIVDELSVLEQAIVTAKSALAAKPGDAAATAALQKAADNLTKGLADARSGDGGQLTKADFTPKDGQAKKEGLYALEQLYATDGLFNLLCLPPHKIDGDIEGGLIDEAAAYCESRRAMLLVDPPLAWNSPQLASSEFAKQTAFTTTSRNAAMFFPRLRQPNPERDNQLETFAPCGAIAGIFARTDAQRGVWKAPAGLDAGLVAVPELAVPLTDEENGLLNPLGINCVRKFPVYGRVVWGARTLRGADQMADEYKYIPVRRTALYIEESLYRGLKWVVFEPNDEPLWAQIRLNAGAFMHNLFRQGAFQGQSPRQAYYVRCDRTTTIQNDIDLGVVNVEVGFAPLKPAEFVVIKLQQIAGQIDV
jgi:phage tail sheath protein FI